MTERENTVAAFCYEQLSVRALDDAMEECGEVHLILGTERADLFARLLAVQTHHDRLAAEQPAARIRFAEAVRAAWFIFRLSVFHGRLFEAQRLAFVLSSSHDRGPETDGKVVFRFVR